MSDEEEYFEESSEAEAFSASEDEWVPSKADKGSESDSDSGPKNKAASSNLSKKKEVELPKRKRLNQSLRNKLYNKYRPPPKVVDNPKILPDGLKKILNQSQAKRKKEMGKKYSESSGSDSSGDDYLVDPKSIDLKSIQMGMKEAAKQSSTAVPDFDCNAGMPSCNSSEEDFEEVKDDKPNDNKGSKISSTINCASNQEILVNQIGAFSSKLSTATEQMKNYKSNDTNKNDEFNVSQLLAMGEVTTEPPKSKSNVRKRKKQESASESDWEDVQDHAIEDQQKNVEIVLPSSIMKPRKDFDLEACIRRKINQAKKEHQVVLHKVALLCWIKNGHFTNSVLNNTTLMSFCLKLIPNASCYPKGRTNVSYFQQIAKWFPTAVKIMDNQMYPKIRNRPPLFVSLGIQIKTKQAICKRDFVLIFIILLRAIGIQCRLVMNVVLPPIRPPQSELCSLSKKKKEDSQPNSSVKKEVPKLPDALKNLNTDQKALKESLQKLDVPETVAVPTKAQKSANVIAKHLIEKNVSYRSPIKLRSKDRKPTASIAKKSENNLNAKEKSKSTASSSNKAKESKSKVKVSTVVDSKKMSKISSLKLNANNKTDLALKSLDGTSSPHFGQRDLNSPTMMRPKDKVLTSAAKTNDRNLKSRQNFDNKKPIKTSQRSKASDEMCPAPKTLKLSDGTSSPHFNKQDPVKTRDKALKNSTKAANVNKSSDDDFAPSSKKVTKPRPQEKIKRKDRRDIPQLDGGDHDNDRPSTSKNARSRKVLSNKKPKNNESSSGEDFAPSPKKISKPHSKLVEKTKRLDRRVLSSDDASSTTTKKMENCVDVWVEAFCEEEEQWISINLFSGKVHDVASVMKTSTQPISYVLAWSNDNTVKDVSARYCPQWNTVTRKQRVDQQWFAKSIGQYLGLKNRRDVNEDDELNKLHVDKPLPTAISEFKNHPLYALKRHLLKFEAIYPADAPSLGFVRGEPIYARDCVHILHSREMWLKQARTVKIGESPYKVVLARPKWDRGSQTVIKNLPLEIYGIWQTQDYEPPTAEDGVVPRNAYGNVELFKECMLPKKTVHLRLPGLNKICRKLRIDCAPAVIGFDFHAGSSHPTYDGFVICEEFKDLVIDAWDEEQSEIERKEEKKREDRVLGNWKKLIKGIWIRERLKKRYNFGAEEEKS